MTSGSLFDRVYRQVRRDLVQGHFLPGDPLEPQVIGDRLFASVTPVRDALHALTAERMVARSRLGGFHVPALSENELRDLYRWQERLAAWTLMPSMIETVLGRSELRDPDIPDGLAVFMRLAADCPSLELAQTLSSATARLAAFHPAERQVLPEQTEDLLATEQAVQAGDDRTARRLLAICRRRRERHVPSIMARRFAMGPLGSDDPRAG